MMRSVVPIKEFAVGIYDGPHATPKPSDEGPIFLGIKNVTEDGRLDFSELRHVSEAEFPKWIRRIKPQRDDIVFSYEATLHRYARIPDGFEGCLGRRLALLRPDQDKVDPRFLHYYFLSPAWRAKMDAIKVTGATVDRIPLTIFPDTEVSLPGLENQFRIADVLSAYDDLIENNRRRIALLEEAARLLYREWFVHFRFPGHEHVKITDGLPKGWERRSLIELAEVIMGQSPKSQYYNELGEGLPFHQGVTDYGFRFVSHRIYSTAMTKIARMGDILVSVRAPVGRINITRDKIVLGRGLAAIRSRTDHQSFSFYALKEHFNAENIIGTGTIYAATNKRELEGQFLLDPPESLLLEFEDRASTIDLQIACLERANERLIQARDFLLPRLMNGEILV